MTYEEIYKELNLLASEEDGDDFESMAKRSINLHYFEILSETNTDLERREFEITTESGVSKYGMPLYVADVINIEDDEQDRPLDLHGPHEYDRRHSGTSTSGSPEEAYWIGEHGVQKQPTQAGALTVESSDNTDTGENYEIVIHGMVGGVQTREVVGFTGTTPASTSSSFDAAKNAVGIRRVVLKNNNNTTFTGNVTIKDSAGVALAVIPPYYGDSPTYQWWEFWPTPSSAQTYVIRSLAEKPPLINPDDWPEIPDQFHDLLIYGPQSVLLAGKGKESAAARAFQKYNERKQVLMGLKQHRGVKRRTFKNVSNPFVHQANFRRIPNAVES
tara:strand:- start:2208 stop:3197 length:990 start_codon:yes stop_codon:yes gene_type:complete